MNRGDRRTVTDNWHPLLLGYNSQVQLEHALSQLHVATAHVLEASVLTLTKMLITLCPY